MRLLHAAAAIVVLAASVPDRAGAQPPTLDSGFRSPSGNIHCQYFDFDHVLRCDLRTIANTPLPRPGNCDLEFGQAFEVFAGKDEAGPICHGDTVVNDDLPILGYGERWQRGDFVCRSERTGVTCRNSVGAGFALSRNAQRVVRAGTR